MAMRPRLEALGAAAAFLACAAFIVSFAIGLRGRAPAPTLDAPIPAATRAPRVIGKVEVLNASGRAGVARAATEQLRSSGFDVVFFGTASGERRDSSVVLDRIGNDNVAHSAARTLGITLVETRRDTTLYLDATVILGRDWPKQPVAVPLSRDTWKSRIAKWLGR